jgi:DNA repair protein RadA/Sms
MAATWDPKATYIYCSNCGMARAPIGQDGLCGECRGWGEDEFDPNGCSDPGNGQKAIRSPKTGSRKEKHFQSETGRKNALNLSLEPAPLVQTLPLAGQPGVVILGLSNVLGAYPKVGKTTLVWHSVLDWLPSRRVVWVTEEPELVWRVRLAGFVSSLAHPLGKQGNELLRNLDLVFIAGRSPGELLEEAFGGEEDIAIVDTLRNALRFSQEADNSEIAAQVIPWIEAARATDKTFLGLHHHTKAGGEHGRGLAGGHALLGVFDMAIEIDRAQHPANRRKVSGLGRLDPVEDFYYELQDGRIESLGEVSQVQAAEVRRRTLDSLSDQGQELDAIHGDIEEPRPGKRQVREALKALTDVGEAIREGTGKKGSPYTWRSER